jgi:hypothetical protein
MRPGLTRLVERAVELIGQLRSSNAPDRTSKPKPPMPAKPKPKPTPTSGRPAPSTSTPSSPRPAPSTHTPSSTKPSSARPSSGRPSAAAVDSELDGVAIEYTPCRDGDPDPGEVVWTWVPYEDDPSQGKDRPVVVFGRRGDCLVGVALTSKHHDNEPQIEVGTGPWDREGRTSYAKLERILDLDPAQVRREGAILERRRFDDLVEALRRVHRLERRG